MTNKTKLTRVQPKLEELLPTPTLRTTYEEVSAAFEAGQLVRALRKHARLSQVELAERLGVEQPRISAIEAGRGRDGPSYALLKRIVVACEIPWIIPGEFSKLISNAEKKKEAAA
jgi:DNA-binding XRE family transcriptional regulator